MRLKITRKEEIPEKPFMSAWSIFITSKYNVLVVPRKYRGKFIKEGIFYFDNNVNHYNL